MSLSLSRILNDDTPPPNLVPKTAPTELPDKSDEQNTEMLVDQQVLPDEPGHSPSVKTALDTFSPGHSLSTFPSDEHALRAQVAGELDTIPSSIARTTSGPDPDEEERRLASSDLEDCREIWYDEIGNYTLQTQKRQNQVEKWFDLNELERGSTAALRMSQHYAARIAKLRPPVPQPPPRTIYSADDMKYTTQFQQEQHPRQDRGFSPHFSEVMHAHPDDGLRRPSFQVNAMDQDPIMNHSKPKSGRKRVAAPILDADELEVPISGQKEPPTKKRKIEMDIQEDMHVYMPDDASNNIILVPSSTSKAKGKGRMPQMREGSVDSVSSTPKPARKKPGMRKKLDTFTPDNLEFMGAPVSASVSALATPSTSRHASPSPGALSVIYELDCPLPPMKRAKKVDDAVMLKRIKGLEESQRKVWTGIARKDVVKVYKYHSLGYASRMMQHKKVGELTCLQARRPFTKTAKGNKDIQAKGKRLMKEMQVFWKKNEREERDARKREHKEAMDRAKQEEERREAARQARKLEFLISQTELYSHFVGNKLKTSEIEGDTDNAQVPVGADLDDLDPASLQDIDFDDDDTRNLHRHAKLNAQEAVAAAKQRAQQFDTQTALERKTNEAIKLSKAQAHVRDDIDDHDPDRPQGLVDLDSDELNFQNPTSLSGPLTIQQPKMLMATLKEYQLKGLNWLATLYEQGINGILADEMGLGKTVQSISLLAYLAETHNIWGPFLVVAPASTLHNWQQELTRFVPGIKAIPYWGNPKDRATLRKFWSKKDISYDKDASFHVLITSYQLVTQDQQYFQRVKWQYMILDEAQNIKNSSSARWKTLLGFQCRNRLLLTGTPIQNSMQELWALLHFIMPSLFDSHDEFNEWFSKDIESAAENKGSKLNEHQLRRLHMILKPFMLRRVKRHVQNELGEKIEIDIYVDLTARQRGLYKSLRSNLSSLTDLVRKSDTGDAGSTQSLLNLVMQFRKVCNHPELFERADVVAPFSFSFFGRPGPLSHDGDFIHLPYSSRSPIEYALPSLFYLDGGLLDVPSENSLSFAQSSWQHKFSIWSVDHIHRSLYDIVPSAFAFLRFIDTTPTEAHALHVSPLIRRRLLALEKEIHTQAVAPYEADSDFAAHTAASLTKFWPLPQLDCLPTCVGLPNLCLITTLLYGESCLSRPELKWYVPAVVAPPVVVHCTDRSFLEHQERLREGPLESLAMYGLPYNLSESVEACQRFETLIPVIPSIGLVRNSPTSQLSSAHMLMPEAKKLIHDSGKMARLDSLLQELKKNDHRVLIYFQMTRMMDLMEEYLIYRQYRYLRLDGSSKLEDRRDMVIDWQTKPEIFIFLLSTRAGGLGINLTAADTVIFYDHDWNPSNDAQAMDRAHRLGQTRQVTVYRLITQGTVDQRIIQLARVKKDVQDLVVGNKPFGEKPSEIAQLLLNDEQMSASDTGVSLDIPSENANPANYVEDGDDFFFGHSTESAAAGTSNGIAANEQDEPSPAPSGTGRKRTARGRKPKKSTLGE